MRIGPVVAAAVLAACAAGCGSQSSAGPPDDVRFTDQAVGLSGAHSDNWHHRRAVTSFVDPREVLALASYPLHEDDDAGECAPREALANLPPDGAFVWLLEYRPPRGDVWAEFPRGRFPPKPARFALRRPDLEPNLSCHDGPGYTTSFRAADRPFQLFVAFGHQASDARLAEVEAILNSLRFAELPPPPQDPYAGWPLINDESGDSLRVPPDWAGAAVTYRPGQTPRPRLLFFTSNRPLAGLPRNVVDRIDEPPFGDLLPTHALANDFPSDGVVVFVVEQSKGDASTEFPQIGGDWPARSNFVPGEIATEPASELRWLRARGMSFGYRFTVWVGRAPGAEERDLALAFEAARSLAVSGCWRDDFDPDCPER